MSGVFEHPVVVSDREKPGQAVALVCAHSTERVSDRERPDPGMESVLSLTDVLVTNVLLEHRRHLAEVVEPTDGSRDRGIGRIAVPVERTEFDGSVGNDP
jgi:hypothetical protein